MTAVQRVHQNECSLACSIKCISNRPTLDQSLLFRKKRCSNRWKTYCSIPLFPSLVWLVIMLFLAGCFPFQIKRPIARLVKDVQRLSNLDFTQTIQIPAIKDLRAHG